MTPAQREMVDNKIRDLGSCFGALSMLLVSAWCLMQAPETPEKLIQGAGVTALLALVLAVL